MSKEILVPLANGFEETEAVTIIDFLRRAGLTVVVAGVPGSGITKGSHGIGIQTDTSISQVADRTFEAVVLPGGMPGATNLAESKDLERILKRQKDRGGLLAAICAAPTVLAKYGLLEGKRATAFPGFESKLTGAKVETDRVVTDGNIVTSRGPGTAIPFSLALVSRLVGDQKAKEIQQAALWGS